MNEEQRDAFWKDATEYSGLLPAHRFNEEWYYIACDTSYVVTDAETLAEALEVFHEQAEGMVAIYLSRGSEHLATYNGGQSEPEGEITYHVTKSALAAWLAVLSAE